MAHYIVTGAAGFIGGHLARRLSVLGHTVSAVDIAPIGVPRLLTHIITGKTNLPFVHFYQKDVCEFTADGDGLHTHEPALDGVFHLAATSGIDPKRERETLANNISSTMAVAELCGANDIPLVFTSSGAVYAAPDGTLAERMGDNCSAYGLSKAWGEQLIRLKCKSGSYRIVRLANVYGVQPVPKAVIGRWIACLQEGKPVPIDGDGSQARDFIAVHDVVDALVLAMEHPGDRAVDVATGAVRAISAEGQQIPSLAQLFQDLLMGGVAEATGKTSTGIVTPMLADLAVTKEEICWAPKTVLADGLVDLFRHHGFPTTA